MGLSSLMLSQSHLVVVRAEQMRASSRLSIVKYTLADELSFERNA